MRPQTSFLVQDGKIIMASRMPEQDPGFQEHLLTQADQSLRGCAGGSESGMYQRMAAHIIIDGKTAGCSRSHDSGHVHE